jgi:two-component system, chemotaxis family, CheB/CheR fusion protein
LIYVTEFFRDPEAYSELANKVIEPAFSSKDPPAQFRIWVAGCATGEEAYSMAILADELARKHNYNGQIIIFATDVHKGSIEYAGQGIYKKEAVTTLNKDRLERYFDITPEGKFRIKMEIRQKVVFACHNLLVDPPFTRMDLVTCRNLLIYLKLDAQDSILRCFHYALRIKGHLLLGNSESLSELENVFHTVSSRAKLFRKQNELDQSKRPHQLYARPKGLTAQAFKLPAPQPTTVSVEHTLLEAYDLVLKRFAPAGVLITTSREVRHYFGGAAEYCSPTEGRANRDFLSMLEGDLRLAVSTTLQRVLSTKQALRSEGIACKTRSGSKVIDVSIIPYLEEDNDLQLLLVTFEPRKNHDSPVETVETRGDFKADEEALNRIVMLEDELRSTKETLQAAVEELQSSNEELYTMNTDLCAVNAELEQKNREILQLNKDHENLLANTEDGILCVDRELRVKQFNPAIAFAFNLLPQDIGRPIEHIAYKLENHDEMLANVKTALETGLHSEHEFITPSGISYLRRVTPFKDNNHNITGAILTYTDITESSQMRSLGLVPCAPQAWYGGSGTFKAIIWRSMHPAIAFWATIVTTSKKARATGSAECTRMT